jgi:hypothetical protein
MSNWIWVAIIFYGSMIAWRLLSRRMHDKNDKEFSAFDYYGWWITLIGGTLVPVVMYIFVF